MAQMYVVEGMSRFVSGKYASSHRSAAMLGYVIGGVIGDIWQEVNSKIEQNGGYTKADCLALSTPIRSVNTVYVSHHARLNSADTFQITHLFVDVQSRPRLER